MACGACGQKQQNVSYEITYRHDGSKEVVGTLSEARMKLAQSPQGGTRRPVPKLSK